MINGSGKHLHSNIHLWAKYCFKRIPSKALLTQRYFSDSTGQFSQMNIHMCDGNTLTALLEMRTKAQRFWQGCCCEEKTKNLSPYQSTFLTGFCNMYRCKFAVQHFTDNVLSTTAGWWTLQHSDKPSGRKGKNVSWRTLYSVEKNLLEIPGPKSIWLSSTGARTFPALALTCQMISKPCGI